MATTIPCTVDTTPMADELQSVSNHIEGTTAAVVTMQSAVIVAENESANKVCSNVNRGFFTLVRSQISQKVASKQSRVEALLMQLLQQKRKLLSIKANMERDYGRVVDRYLRIFTNINKELESRIRNVDQPVFELVNKHLVTSSNRMNSLTSWVAISQKEGVVQSQHILVSKMKNNAQFALNQSTNFLSQVAEQRVLTRQVLISYSTGDKSSVYQLPTVIIETIDGEAGIPKKEVLVSDALSRTFPSQIDNIVRQTKDFNWEESEKPQPLSDEFDKIVDTSNLSSRVKDLVKGMYSSSNFQTL